MNFKEICRTCLLQSDTMFPLFNANVRLVDAGTETAKIVDLLKMFTKLLLSRNEGFPENICSACLDDIMRTYNFRIKCERSETTWRQTKNKDNDKVCRTCLDSNDSMFTLFNQILFTIGNESASVIDLIKNFTNILISLDDDFPKWICKNCIDEMKISYALKVKCENSERTLESYLKETQLKAQAQAHAHAQAQAQAQNGNQIVALNEMDISQLEFICMKEESGGIEANENFIKNVDCGNVLSNDLNKNSSNGQQSQHQQHQQHQQPQQPQQQHQHHQHQIQHQQQLINVANASLVGQHGNANSQHPQSQPQQTHNQHQPQKVVKLDLLKLYPNNLLDQNFAIEEVIEDNINNISGAGSYEQGIIRGSIIDPNHIQLESNQEEIIEENINDSNLLMEDCEIEEVVENDDMEHDQDSSHQFGEARNHQQFDGSGLDLDEHRTELDGDGVDEAYKCPGCATVFVYNETLRKHIFENHTNKDLCMICNKAVYNSMWIHVINHIPKNHRCPECGKGFIAKSYVRSHINNVHHHLKLPTTAVKRSQCPECSKSFDKKSDLHKHMLEHTNTYARCDCSNSAEQKPVEETVTPGPEEKKPHLQLPKSTFQCSACSREFPTQLALDTHFATKHSEDKNFKCTLCTATFRLKGYLSKHVKNVHKKKNVNDFMEILGKS